MSYDSLFIQRAAIERASRSVDSTGDVSLSWQSVAAEVPCRIEVRQSTVRVHPAGDVLVTTVRGLFPPGTDIRPRAGSRESDRVTVDSVVYRVTGVLREDDAPARPVEVHLERTE